MEELISPAWYVVVITGAAALGSIALQAIFMGRYLERVDQLVRRQSETERDVQLIKDKVETLVVGMGKFRLDIFNYLRGGDYHE